MADERPHHDSLALDATPPLVHPAEPDWTTVPLRELIHHLVSDHHDYFRKALPGIQERLDEVIARHGCDDGLLRPLARVFEALRMDLLIHMEKEELLLFPTIERYESGIEEGKPIGGSPFAAFGGPVNVIEHEHESVGAAVRLIRDFTGSYAAPVVDCELYRGLIDSLREFEARLADHMNLENNVLFPRAAALHTHRNKNAKYGSY